MLCTRAVTWGHVSFNLCDQEYPDSFYCTVIQWDTCPRTTCTFWPRLFILLFRAELATPFSTMFLQSVTRLCIVSFETFTRIFFFIFHMNMFFYFGPTPIWQFFNQFEYLLHVTARILVSPQNRYFQKAFCT